jgi:hypothetical protein
MIEFNNDFIYAQYYIIVLIYSKFNNYISTTFMIIIIKIKKYTICIFTFFKFLNFFINYVL